MKKPNIVIFDEIFDIRLHSKEEAKRFLKFMDDFTKHPEDYEVKEDFISMRDLFNRYNDE